MLAYKCPICANPLNPQNSGQQFACEQQHHFDLAKAGYLNLLPVQHKHSLEPGDNKTMLQARRAFLEAGYFQPLVDGMSQMLNLHCVGQDSLKFLDLGCGEGYYSRTLAPQMPTAQVIQWHGIDIAKFAVAAAAKKYSHGHFAVGSTKRLPYLDHYFDGMLRIFAPADPDEISRVLKPSGFLLTVTPGPRHLWALKALIYPDVREHRIEPDLPANFKIVCQARIEDTIYPAPAHRLALLQMTPFAWKADANMLSRLQNEEAMAIEVDFCVALAVPSN